MESGLSQKVANFPSVSSVGSNPAFSAISEWCNGSTCGRGPHRVGSIPTSTDQGPVAQPGRAIPLHGKG